MTSGFCTHLSSSVLLIVYLRGPKDLLQDSCNQKYYFSQRDMGSFLPSSDPQTSVLLLPIKLGKPPFNLFSPYVFTHSMSANPSLLFQSLKMFSVLLRAQTFGKQKPVTTYCFCFLPHHTASLGHKQLATSDREKVQNERGKKYINNNI